MAIRLRAAGSPAGEICSATGSYDTGTGEACDWPTKPCPNQAAAWDATLLLVLCMFARWQHQCTRPG